MGGSLGAIRDVLIGRPGGTVEHLVEQVTADHLDEHAGRPSRVRDLPALARGSPVEVAHEQAGAGLRDLAVPAAQFGKARGVAGDDAVWRQLGG